MYIRKLFEPAMKKAINFRLNKNTLFILTLLEQQFHTSKTDVVEKALAFYADKKLKTHNPLMQYAGVFSDEDADTMLTTIRRSRRNKKIKVDL